MKAYPNVVDCAASLISVQNGTVMLLSHVNSQIRPTPMGRRNLTLSISLDSGVTFYPGLQVHEGPAAYSTLTELLMPASAVASSASVVGLAYESSPATSASIDFAEISFARISVPTALKTDDDEIERGLLEVALIDARGDDPVPDSTSRTFYGFGGLSAGASTRMLLDYQPERQSEVLDLLFSPGVAFSFQILKLEMGGASWDTCILPLSHH